MPGVGTHSDYLNFLKQYHAEQQGVANWNSIFTSMLDTQYKIGSTELERTSQKNIDSAYSNYLHNQMSLKYTDNLTEGYRRYAEDSTKNEYDAAVATEQQNLIANKATLYTELAQNVAEQQATYEKELDKDASVINKILNKDLLEYASQALALNGDGETTFAEEFSNMFNIGYDNQINGWSDDANRYMFNEDGTYSDLGKEFMSYMLGSGFNEWAQKTYDPDEWSDYQEKYSGLINQTLFGQAINPYNGFNAKQQERAISDTIRHNKINTETNLTMARGQSLIGTKTVNDVFSDVVNENSSWLEALILKSLSPEFDKHLRSAYGKNWSSSNLIENDLSNLMNTSLAKDNLTKDQQTAYRDLTTTIKNLRKTKDLQQGDIIEYDNVLLWYSGNGNFRVAENSNDNRKALGLSPKKDNTEGKK